MDLVSFAWSGFGAAFGPIIILALFWKHINAKGAMAGMLTGFIVDIMWNSFFNGIGIINVNFSENNNCYIWCNDVYMFIFLWSF